MNKKYIKGAEWRKWDLHIHTPGSFYWKGSKKLKEMTPKEIESEMNTFIDHVNKSDIEVFCLMDYWNFDWYIELLKFNEANPTKLQKTIFPGMELRVNCPVDYRLNIHCILSDKLTKQELIDFKSELHVSSIKKKLSDEAIIQFAKTLDESKARKHGFDNPEILVSEKLFELGAQTIEVTQESLIKAFDQIPNNSGYIILPYDTSDGLLKLDWEKHPHADNYFMQSAHIFETRDRRNIELISGVKTENNKKIFDNFFKTLGNKSKPCISGSDAHQYSKYGRFPNNKVTWVKGNPTFEGLKQIIYEPIERVKIQETRPDIKLDSNVIDKVRFIPKEGNLTFSNDWIHINESLNTIIGGKSSGKSLLLSLISKTIDSSIDISQYQKLLDENIEDFEVVWRDGIIFKYKDEENYFDKEDQKFQKRRPISYIPQLAIHKLIEEKPDEYRDIILNFLKEDEKFKEYYESFEKGVDDTIEDIDNSLTQLFKVQSILEREQGELKHLGDFKAKKAEADNLKERLKSMGLDNLSDEEKGLYKELKNNIEEVSSILTTKIQLKDTLEKYEQFIDERIEALESEILEKYEELSGFVDEEVQTEVSVIRDEILRLKSQFRDEVKRIFEKYNTLEKEIISKTEEKDTKQLQFDKFSEKTGDENQIRELSEKLSELTQEVKEIEKFEKKASIHNKKIEDLTEKISNSHETLIEKYKNLRREINLNYSELIKEDGIELSLEIGFNNDEFYRDFVDLFDLRNSIASASNYFSNNTYKYNLSTYNAMVSDFLGKLINKDVNIKFKQQFEHDKAIRAITHNYLVPIFRLSQSGEEVESMSYGKRSLVLLKLYLALNKNENPILIDQPEDNLDNRTIYSELKAFIRTKKKQRQIIIVTHNANLVVSTDAESIIVASQDGQNEKINKQNKFEYVSGALEDSFIDEEEIGILFSMGIKEHVCDVLEGGKKAFEERELKYGFK